MVLAFLLVLPLTGLAQNFSITGRIVDDKLVPLQYATLALLDPADSTLAYYGISNSQGVFDIKNIKGGSYLLQAAFIGFETFYKSLEFPGQDRDLGIIGMKTKVLLLDEAEVTAERIPLLIKKDTIEYDAAAYKTKPDAAVEDLLKKLPGVEVDRAGNVKAQGEDVRNVLVDGKEFFGNDPKVATKNLPADAIDKVQVYDKNSDEAELTGVDDGIRSKTVNLLLKENKKSAWLGELNAGIGTDEHYQSAAKVYRFTKTNQFAALGMINNINQFGFSFQDYLDFSGGFSALTGGDGDVTFQVSDDDNFPINFGQPVLGLISSGAGGLNYSYEKNRDNRISISYMGNGTDKKLMEESVSTNYTESSSFTLKEDIDEKNRTFNHRINLTARKKIGGNQNFLISANGSLHDADLKGSLSSRGSINDSAFNDLKSLRSNSGNGYSLGASATYLAKWEGNWKLLKIAADISSRTKDQNSSWSNSQTFYQPFLLENENRYLNESESSLNYSASTSLTRSLGKRSLMIPAIKGGRKTEKLDIELGNSDAERLLIDSLSSDIESEYEWIRPSLTYRYNTMKTQLSLSAQLETGSRYSKMMMERRIDERINYFTPRLSWQYEYRKGRDLSAGYETDVNVPQAAQLYPSSYNSNSLQRVYGNRNLKSEYSHAVYLHSMIFDQFSFTSLFTGLSARYTRDKINWSRTVDEQLNQVLTLVNVKDDYTARGNAEFKTPIRKLKLNISIDFQERWNQGINSVNGIENINTNYSHSLSLKLDNRKKQKWDIAVGAGLDYTQARYSIGQELNNDYFSINYFSELSFTPNDKWNFHFSADVTEYKAKSFRKSQTIPMLNASLNRYLLKNGRLVIGLEVHDILDENSGIQRISELNYLQEKNSNTIGRYLMLNLKFRLNKFSRKGGGNVDIDIK
jgi:hypothetical protein